MTRRTTLAAAAALALTALPACGDEPRADTRAQVETALNAFTRAVAAGDAEEACARLTEAAREELVAEFSPYGATDCEAAVREAASMLSDPEGEAFDELAVRRVRVRGDRAEVADEDLLFPAAVDPAPNDSPTVFRRVGGEWLIEDLG